MMNRISRLTLGVLWALGCGNAVAMGLGPIEVRSGLNQPRLAEIPILSVGESVEEMRAQLAGPEDLRRVGIDTSAISVPLYFDVVEDSRGRPIIRVTSNEPVREPYLSFLVEANWGKGRLLREYSVLLDPPVFAPAVVERVSPPTTSFVAPASSPPRPASPAVVATPPGPAAQAPAPATSPAMAAPAPRASTPPAPAPAPAPAASAAPKSDQYTVKSGDALYDIAVENRPDSSVSINQMMIAMLRANPSAFYKDNINALKKGAVLRIPDTASARELSAAAAAAEVASQARAWAGAAEPARVADSGPSPKPAAATAPSRAAASAAKREDRLALVPPKAGTESQSGTTRAGTAGGTGSAEAASLRGDLARTREQLTSREQEAVELRTRVKDLEKIGGESKRLIELKNNEIAALKQQLDAQEKRLADAQQAAAAARAAAVKAGTPPTSVAASPNSTATPASAAPLAAATPGALDPSTPPLESPTVSTVPPATAPGVVDPLAGTALAQNPEASTTATPSGAVVDPAAEPASSEATPTTVATSASEDAPTSTDEVPTSATVDDRPAPRPWYLNPLYGIGAIVLALLGLWALFGRRKPPEVVDVIEIERPSVANEFSDGVLPASPPPAYGSTLAAPLIGDDVLERALLDRRAADPENLEHHLDVLRHYHELRDHEKFVDAASEMRNYVLDDDHYAWLEAQELGRDIDPNHVLFASTMAAAAHAPDDDFDFRPVSGEPPTPVGYQAAIPATTPPPINLADEDWDQPRAAPVAAPTYDGDFAVDTPQLDRPVIDEPELTHYQFDELPEAPRSASSPVLGEDAVATKLDLARAYIDMGDSDGARAMLQEVLIEGSGAQQTEAQRLIDGLS